MSLCTACGYENPNDIEICLNCAATLSSSCPACGVTVPAGNKFCGQCGTRLVEVEKPVPVPQPTHLEMLHSLRAMMPTPLADKIQATQEIDVLGQRREVTVLFVDVNEFTATAHDLDSEDVFLLIDEAMRILVEVVYKYEGTIDKFTGDGLMALFGAPITHENDPERAVRAGLEMQEVLKPFQERVRREYGFDFQVRIGIHTGLVIAGKVGSDLHMEYTVIGDTVNLANRLQSAATPGTILVSFETYQRTRPIFEYKKVAPLSLKGLPQPVVAYQALALREVPGKVRGLPGLQVPMIGRQEALDQLKNAFQAMQQQQQRWIALVTGQAGLGKSRLVEEFCHSIGPTQVKVYQGGCLTYARSRPLWVVAELIRDILRVSEMDPVELQCQALHNYLQSLGLATDDVFPYLVHLLGLSHPDSDAEARLRLLDAAMLQRQTHAALRQLLLATARLAPTVFVFEDLHWVDPASRDFLEYWIQTTGDEPFMLVLVSRDVERGSVIRSLIENAQKQPDRLVDIQLQVLSEAEGQLLVDQLVKPATAEARVLKKQIAQRAGGVPFYVEEIVRMLIDQGGLEKAQTGWRVMPAAEELLHQVPGTLKGLILTRFDRLPDHLRATLQQASVLGSAFPVSLLQTLSGLPSETLAMHLQALEERQFLVKETVGAAENYAFQHTLIQEAIYGTLLKRDRRRLHDEAGQAIEQMGFGSPEERIEMLAHHYAEGTDPTRAVSYLLLAAQNADRRCANETTTQQCRRALRLIGDSFRHDLWHYLQIRLMLSRALKYVGTFDEATHHLQAVLEWVTDSETALPAEERLTLQVTALRELADIRQREGAYEEAVAHLEKALAALGPNGESQYPNQWRSLMDRMAWVRFRQGDLEAASEFARHATAGLDEATFEDPATLASLYNTLGGVLWQRGAPSEAITYVERSLALYRKLGYAWGTAIAYTNLGVLYFVQGMWPKAAQCFERAYVIRRENGYLPEQALNLNNLGTLRMAMGDHAQARNDLEASLSISRRLGDDYGVVLAELGLAHLLVIQERFQEASVHIREAMGRMTAAGEDEAIQAQWLMALVEADRDILAGLETGFAALDMARKAGLVEAEADCRRVLGILLARSGEYQRGISQLQKSIALCVDRNDPYREGLALYALGDLYERLSQADGQQGAVDRSQALDAYHQATKLFRRLGAAYDLERAEAAIQRLETAMHPALADGEWHLAAVVWVHLNPMHQVEDETIFETLSWLVPYVTDIAMDLEGELVRYPDGFMVIYGVPVTHEDDPVRAVQTALQIRRKLREMEETADCPVVARIAVAQGPVMVRSDAPDPAAESVIRGEPVQQVQRMVAHMPANKIWVSPRTRTVTEHLFAYLPANEESEEAEERPPAAELIGMRETPGSARGLPGIKAPLIGRDVPLQAMQTLAQNLEHGMGGVIWVEGEAGIGKTRLIQEFARQMRDQGRRVYLAQSSLQHAKVAFSLFADLLRSMVGAATRDTPAQICARIDQAMENWSPAAHEARPYLELLLGVGPADTAAQRIAALEPDQLRQQIFVAMRQVLRDLATSQPVVAVLDDLHWVDPMSAELLLFLSNMISTTPILFVCAHRPADTHPLDARLVKVQALHPAQTIRLTLDRLSDADCHRLLQELLSQATLPARLQKAILEKSEGNPYYLEEFVRTLIEHGYLRRQQDGQWRLDSSLQVKDLPLPSSLEALVRSRVDVLPADLKQILQCAAIIGRSFPLSLLQRIADKPNLEPVLHQLAARGMVRPTQEAGQWQFSHSVTETVVYQSLLKIRRKSLHLKVARILEMQWAGEEQEHAEALAYHYTRAGEAERSLHYLVLSGERAAARYANEEALAYFQEAAQLAENLEVDENVRWRITVGLGDVYRFIGKYAESTAVLEAGLDLAESSQLDNDRRAGLYRRLGETAQKQGELERARRYFEMAQAILGKPTDQYIQREAARLMTSVAWNYYMQGQFEQAQKACEAGLSYARGAGKISLNEMAAAENLLGGIYYQRGEWEAAHAHTLRAMRLRKEMGYTWGVAATLNNLGVLAIAAGEWEKAREFFEESLAQRQDLGDVEGIAIVHNNLGSLARDQGDLTRAEWHFRQSLAVAVPLDIAYHVANSTLGLAQVLLLRGKPDSAGEMLSMAFGQIEAIGAQDLHAEACRVEAERLLAEGRWMAAREMAHQSRQLASETGNRTLQASAWRLIAAVELEQHNLQLAAEALSEARAVLSDVTDQLEAARIEALAGRLYLKIGAYEQARRAFQTAQTRFLNLGASLDLCRVEEAWAKCVPIQDLGLELPLEMGSG